MIVDAIKDLFTGIVFFLSAAAVLGLCVYVVFNFTITCVVLFVILLLMSVGDEIRRGPKLF